MKKKKKQRLLKEEKLRRLKNDRYKHDPMFWLEDRFKESADSYQWTAIKQYKNHKWDGDVNPLLSAWNAIADKKWVAIEAATGCHGKDTELIMFDGSVKLVQDITVGEQLMGDDSTPRNVLELARGRELMYKIIPENGEPFVCNESHILSLKKHKNSLPITVSIKDFINWNNKNSYNLYKVPVTYRGQIVSNPYITGLQLNLQKDDNIPKKYLINTTDIRLKFLSGILDSNGYYENNNYYIEVKYTYLSQNISILARSIGLRVYVTELTDSSYLLVINDNSNIIPTKVKSKYICKPNLLTSFRIEKLGIDNYYGFELDSNHLYLLNDFTVTHNTSKTFWLSRLVFWFLDNFEDSLVVTTAPKQDQLKLHLWAEITKSYANFKRIQPEAQILSLNMRVVGATKAQAKDNDFSQSWQAIGFVAGANTEEESATKAQGFHRKNMLIILEEAPGLKQSLINAFKNTCTASNNIIVAVGNPDSELDTLHRFAKTPGVESFRISAYDYPNVVLNKEVMPGAVTRASIDRRLIEYGENSPFFLSRVRGMSPKQSPDSLIKIDWIDQCINSLVKMDNTANAVGVDVARSLTGDKAALAWGESNILLKIEEFVCPNASYLAYNLINDEDKNQMLGYENYDCSRLYDYNVVANYVGIDVVGIGASTIETLYNQGYDCQSLQGGQWKEAIPTDEQGKPLYNFASLRAQMYWYAREDLRLGKIRIQLDDYKFIDQLKKELGTVKYVNNANKITVELKEKIIKRLGYSPNVADAFVYWNFTRHGFRAGALHNLSML